MRRTFAGGAILLAVALAMAWAAPARADVAPFGQNDAGGFRNVLPPGEHGTDNALQLGQYQLNGQLPPHYDDQLALYRDLVYASPNLTHEQIPTYFKDATFGVRPADVQSTEQPRTDVTIVRDRAYGVPHVYGTTRSGVTFGAGYAGAEDRLFLMDILRHTGRAELSSFAGGAAGNRAMDRTQWAIAPYTEADLQSQIDNAPKLYGAKGEAVVADVVSYVAGINAYIDAAMLNPNLLPAEYAAFGKVPEHFTATDVVATASLVGGIFGKGGGEEVRSALILQAFEKRFGSAIGRSSWSDFRSKNDTESPTTLTTPFPYEDASPFSTRGLAMPDPGSVSFTPVGPPLPGATRASTRSGAQAAVPADGSVGAGLLAASRKHTESNWELISARRSAAGHPIAVMGPQVGYYVPQILMEEDLHGPGIDARGASFPGLNLYVLLGHGRDYAWSATTANSDNVDTFAEVLCEDDHHYEYRGQCLPMERLDRPNSWMPNVSDKTPPGSETLTAWRTVHGIVYARGTVGARPVAYARSRTTYFHEADSAIGISEYNDPGFLTGPEQFQKASSDIGFGFNWAYVDANHIAYYHSGLYPQRAAGTSPDFPVLGTGEFDWKGYDPTLHTLDALPFAAHPNAIDPDYLVSWNNKQAPQWSAADDRYAYSSVYRSQLIEAGIRRALAHGQRMRIEQLVSAMDEPATQDLRAVALWPILRRALGTPTDPRLQGAIGLLDRWYADGGHRRDLKRSGTDEDNDAIRIMDAWWPKLLQAEFGPTLGADAFSALQTIIPFGAPNPGDPPAAPDYEVGWYGFVSKDLRDLLAAAARPSAGAPRCRLAGRRVRRHGHLVLRRGSRCVRRARPLLPVVASGARPLRHRRPHLHRRADHVAVGAVSGAYSRVYCGGGSPSGCRQALQASLLAALAVTPQQIYGTGDCAADPQASCYDQDRSVIASGVALPPFPFQNRPTFQQVVELTRKLGR